MTPAQVRRYYELIDRKAKNLFTKQWLHWDNPVDGHAMPAVAYPTRASWRLVASRLDPVHPAFFEAVFAIPAP
jgi:hypothetical protein